MQLKYPWKNPELEKFFFCRIKGVHYEQWCLQLLKSPKPLKKIWINFSNYTKSLIPQKKAVKTNTVFQSPKNIMQSKVVFLIQTPTKVINLRYNIQQYGKGNSYILNKIIITYSVVIRLQFFSEEIIVIDIWIKLSFFVAFFFAHDTANCFMAGPSLHLTFPAAIPFIFAFRAPFRSFISTASTNWAFRKQFFQMINVISFS